MYAYVGSRTSRERNARGAGITVFKLDPATDALVPVQVVGGLVNPSFLAINRRGDTLYTVHGDQDEVSAFRIDASSGQLHFLNQQACGGRNPVHLALDPLDQHLVVSNHLSGTLAVLPVLADGALGELSQLVTLEGQPGPHRVEQPFAKPHFNPFDLSGRKVLVPDKGLDRVFSFHFADGQLHPATPPSLQCREASGPRHLAFHPRQPFAYVVNELDSTVTACRFHTDSGALEPLQIVSTLPEVFTGNSRASEVALDASGRWLYASNRGCDSIAVFAVHAGTGHLQRVQVAPSLGRTPRFFALSPSGQTLFVLNEDSDAIVSMAVDPDTGHLTPTGHSLACGSPVCMVFSPV